MQFRNEHHMIAMAKVAKIISTNPFKTHLFVGKSRIASNPVITGFSTQDSDSSLELYVGSIKQEDDEFRFTNTHGDDYLNSVIPSELQSIEVKKIKYDHLGIVSSYRYGLRSNVILESTLPNPWPDVDKYKPTVEMEVGISGYCATKIFEIIKVFYPDQSDCIIEKLVAPAMNGYRNRLMFRIRPKYKTGYMPPEVKIVMYNFEVIKLDF